MAASRPTFQDRGRHLSFTTSAVIGVEEPMSQHFRQEQPSSANKDNLIEARSSSAWNPMARYRSHRERQNAWIKANPSSNFHHDNHQQQQLQPNQHHTLETSDLSFPFNSNNMDGKRLPSPRAASGQRTEYRIIGPNCYLHSADGGGTKRFLGPASECQRRMRAANQLGERQRNRRKDLDGESKSIEQQQEQEKEKKAESDEGESFDLSIWGAIRSLPRVVKQFVETAVGTGG